MMRFAFLPVLAIAFGTAACSGNDGEIKVTSAATPLTAQGNDNLFTIEVVDARDDGYETTGFRVKVIPDGKDAVDVTCILNDVNTNKKLDKGDTLGCSEGPENKLDTGIAGKEANVELYTKIDGSEERIGDATWTPK